MSTKTKVLLKKKTTTNGATKTTKPTVSAKTKTASTAGKKRVRLMSIGFGATNDLIKKIDAVAGKRDMTRAKFMKVAVEKAIGLR